MQATYVTSDLQSICLNGGSRAASPRIGILHHEVFRAKPVGIGVPVHQCLRQVKRYSAALPGNPCFVLSAASDRDEVDALGSDGW